MISSVTNQGKVRFMFYSGSFNVQVFLRFLRRLLCDAKGRKIHLIVDNLRVHHARKLQAWLSTRSDLIEQHYLPRYSPDPNPDEYLNNDLKSGIGQRADHRKKGRLAMNPLSQMRSIQKQPGRVRNCFDAAPVRYAH